MGYKSAPTFNHDNVLTLFSTFSYRDVCAETRRRENMKTVILALFALLVVSQSELTLQTCSLCKQVQYEIAEFV